MESTSLISSNPFLSSGTSCRVQNHHRLKNRISSTKILSMRRRSRSSEAYDHQNCSGRLVDANMIVLRKRIHERKMIERNYEPPEDWMEWEKRYYTSYDSIICDVLGVLQTLLMNTRPSLALGLLVLISLSVPTSAAVIFFHLMDMTKGVF